MSHILPPNLPMQNRGLKFLIGLVAMYAIYQGWDSGRFHDWGLMLLRGGGELSEGGRLTSIEPLRGPLAVIFDLVIDLTVIIGELTILVSSGVWSGVVWAFNQLSDLANAGSLFLRETAAERRVARRATEQANPAAALKPSISSAPSETTTNPPKDPVLVIVDSLQELKAGVGDIKLGQNELSQRVSTLEGKRVPAASSSKAAQSRKVAS